MGTSLTLTTRFGGGIQQPADEELRNALHEVYVEEAPGLTEADYAEHPNAWLTYGYDSDEGWTEFTVDVYRSHLVVLTKLADQDDPEPEFEHRLRGVSEDTALEFWRLLAKAEVRELREHFEPK